MQQWNLSLQRQVTANYLGNKSSHRASVVALSPRFTGRWAQRILGSWETSAIMTKRSGYWFNTGTDRDNSLTVPRRFAVTERHKVEARAQAFNILNHPVFGGPRSSLTDANVGRILGANDPRILQFALKYIF